MSSPEHPARSWICKYLSNASYCWRTFTLNPKASRKIGNAIQILVTTIKWRSRPFMSTARFIIELTRRKRSLWERERDTNQQRASTRLDSFCGIHLEQECLARHTYRISLALTLQFSNLSHYMWPPSMGFLLTCLSVKPQLRHPATSVNEQVLCVWQILNLKHISTTFIFINPKPNLLLSHPRVRDLSPPSMVMRHLTCRFNDRPDGVLHIIAKLSLPLTVALSTHLCKSGRGQQGTNWTEASQIDSPWQDLN